MGHRTNAGSVGNWQPYRNGVRQPSFPRKVISVANVTKLSKAKNLRCKTRSFRKTLKWVKSHAHRSYRHAAKQAIKTGREINEKPRLTDWDII